MKALGGWGNSSLSLSVPTEPLENTASQSSQLTMVIPACGIPLSLHFEIPVFLQENGPLPPFLIPVIPLMGFQPPQQTRPDAYIRKTKTL